MWLAARTGGLPHDTGGFSRKQIGCKVKEGPGIGLPRFDKLENAEKMNTKKWRFGFENGSQFEPSLLLQVILNLRNWSKAQPSVDCDFDNTDEKYRVVYTTSDATLNSTVRPLSYAKNMGD